MIRVWSDRQNAGLLDRHLKRGATFAYDPKAKFERAVSLTMPVRVASWDVEFGLHPIFEMNMPEGVLREQLRSSFAKAIGTFDEFDLLSIVGRSQLGRLRYTAADADLDENVPFQSVDEILKHKRDGDLFMHMMERFATFSGISGVQPKVLIRDETDSAIESQSKERKSASFQGATHIVKFWNEAEFPHLALNEYFCLHAAKRCGLSVPRFRLTEDGGALVLDRFDLAPDGSYLGLEDFCVLNGVGTASKYDGGYETKLFDRLEDYVAADALVREREKLFVLFVLNCALRNGDAHLKNFALLYENVTGAPTLAPVYDIVTTTAYIEKDKLALTLDGTTRWPDAKRLERLGAVRCQLSAAEIQAVFSRVADATRDTAKELGKALARYKGFKPVGEAMLKAWNEGVAALSV
jgi:serine/threonine-protein kinase HipA